MLKDVLDTEVETTRWSPDGWMPEKDVDKNSPASEDNEAHLDPPEFLERCVRTLPPFTAALLDATWGEERTPDGRAALRGVLASAPRAAVEATLFHRFQARRVWDVRVFKDAGANLGVTRTVDFVVEVVDGPLRRFNSLNPFDAVLPGDVVVQANGEDGDNMWQVIRETSVANLTIRRPGDHPFNVMSKLPPLEMVVDAVNVALANIEGD
jgi:hypothetical protein